ncbi:MAG: hypothetical protein IJ269_00650 [Bacteroidales bacterium]|nr:hypothetical protein [Bacteroidales bacterium]
MSITISNEVAKAQFLAEGLRKKIELVKNKGLDEAFISQLEASYQELKTCDEELEAYKKELRERVKENNAKLADLKAKMLIARKTVKANYAQVEWIEFGVQDKK